MMALLDRLRGRKLLLAASTGGHLAQLNYLARIIEPHPESLWVTFDNPQSRSMADGRRMEFVDYIAPRNVLRAMRGGARFREIVRRENFDAAVSTGAAIALSSLPVARSSGIPAVYIESVSRYAGPSLSGKIVSFLPGITLRTQHPEWASKKWPFEFSVMDTWSMSEVEPPRNEIKRIFVTLGTIQPYRFDSLVDAVLRVLPSDVEVEWQLGATTRDDLPGKVHLEMDASEFDRAAKESDVVISHAGVGSIMNFLNAGVSLVTVPRRRIRNEHVDDHQTQVARDLRVRQLCAVVEAAELSFEDLERSRRISVVVK
jgi:UDP-N-acetylglucosamine transferase subunit ALG13